MIPCATCNGCGVENPEAAIARPPGDRPLCRECRGTGEQSPSAEDLEIDRLRADVRHLREAMQSIRWHALMAGDKADRLVTCLNIATDTLKRVAQ